MTSRTTTSVAAASACACLMLFAACGSDNPAEAPLDSTPKPLATMTFGWGFGVWAESVDHVVLSIGPAPLGSRGYLAIVNLDAHQQGDTLTYDSRTPASFARFVDLFTNGIADTIDTRLSVLAAEGGANMGPGHHPEIDALVPRAGHVGVDLADTLVSRVELTIDQLRIAIPGSDLNHDGRWIDTHAVLTLSVY